MRNTTRVLVVILGCAAALQAQQGRGVIFGTITDPSAAPIPGVKVTVKNLSTNAVLEALTGPSGEYTTPAIPVGNYQLNVDQTGFRPVVRSGIVLQVDERAEINIQLAVGTIEQKVEITGDAPLVDTTSATVGNVVENKRIAELPLNGRNALALVFLEPNVKSQAGATNSGFADRGLALSSSSINGGPSSVNAFLLDGGNNNQAFVEDLNVNPTVDAIEEFKVQSGVLSAEYGFTLGGVINIVTRSGTNDVHGAAYEFVRNNAFDARNTFAPAIPPYQYNQYGGAMGGPAYIPKLYDGRNKTFLFFNIEQWQYRLGSNPITTVPTVPQRTGDFSRNLDATGKLIPIYDTATTVVNPSGSGYVRSVFPGNIIPSSRLDPSALKYLALVPMPNRTPDNAFTQSNNYIGSPSQHEHMEQYLVKADQYFSSKNQGFFRYMYYNEFNDNGGNIYTNPILAFRYDNLESRNAVIGDTHMFSPTLFNETRLDLARSYFPFQNASYKQNVPQQLGLPASVPDYEIPLINGLPTGAAQDVGIRGQTTWQLYDSVTWVRGAHNFKFGVDARLLRFNNYQVANLSGNYSFVATLTGNPQAQSGTGSGYATFLLGDVSSATINTGLGQAEAGHSFTWFTQDDWHVTHRLTINLGLRYDYQTWPVERYNGISNFLPAMVNPQTHLLGEIGYAGKDFGRSPFNGSSNVFSPRAGFAYDLGSSRTVIRGGYGIYYESVFSRDFAGATAGFASTTTTFNPPGGNANFPAFIFSQGLPSPPVQSLGSALGPSAFLGQSVSYSQPIEKTPMSQQWDVTVQRQLPGNWVAEIGYAGNHSDHLVAGGYDLNQLPQQYLSLGNALQNNVPNPYAGIVPGSLGGATIAQSQALKPYPYYSAINVSAPTLGNSIYHAGFLSVQKRLSHGLVLLASYTKAKLISDSVSVPVNFGPVVQTTTVGYQNGVFNRAAERSIDPTNVAQRLVVSSVYELPFGRGKKFAFSNPAVDAVLGGWQVQGILTIQTGLPIIITGANNNLATRPNSTGQSAALDNPSRTQWFNTAVFVNPPNYTFGNVARTLPDLTGPKTVNVDLSLIKNVHVWERFSIQLRAESFNSMNHVNLGQPNASFVAGANGLNSSSTFGTITSAAAARTYQFGAKVVF
jgi:outer membrane receptor protein involved in Fe transport